MTSATISPEIRERITQTANNLYEQHGFEKLPTVDEVRRAARTDMNTTSTVMRDWRKERISQSAPVVAVVPERVKQAFENVLATAWNEAQNTANETLDAARKSWEEERTEADQLRAEMAEAFETQEAALSSLKTELTQTQQAKDGLQTDYEQQQQQTNTLNQSVQELTMKLAMAERHTSDGKERISELKTELTDLKKTQGKDREDMMKARENNAVITGELSAVKQKLTGIKQANDTLRTQLTEQQQETGRVNQTVQELTLKIAVAERHAADSDNRINELKSERDGLKSQIEKTSQETIKIQEHNAYLSGELDAVKRERDSLRK